MHNSRSILFKLKFSILAGFLLFLNGCSLDNGPSRPDTEDVRVVVLLPLSGAYAHIGDTYLKEIELALFEHADMNLKAQILDTKGTFEGTLDALKKVETADVVLGPVLSTSVDAASIWALKRNIPVVSLNNNITKAQRGVFIFGIPPQVEIEEMLKFSIKQSLTRFSAIVPSGSFGSTVHETLEEISSAYGATLVDVFSYNQTLDELPTIIQKMKTKSVDGVFIVNGGQDLYKISNALKKANIDVQLMGTQQWAPSDIHHWRQLGGAWYTSAYSSQKEIFEKRYFSLYKKEPNTSAYLAYDAMAMLAKLHKLGLEKPFSIKSLTSPMGFIGLQGMFKLGTDGQVTRRISIMKIQNGGSHLMGTSEGK